MKKVILLGTMLFGIISFASASQKFTVDENQQIDKQVQMYIKQGLNTKLLDNLKTQEAILREINTMLTYENKSDFIGYGIAKYPTPVLWYPVWFPNLDKSFGADPYTGLGLDAYQQIDELDFVALPGTVFTIIGQVKKGDYLFYQIRNREFGTTSPSDGYYIDSRFVDVQKQKPIERLVNLPSLAQIYKRLLSASGTVYVRGGNVPGGIEQLNDFYPSTRQKTDLEKAKKIIKGVDCSGLLYRATDGYTPRNTSSLVIYGEGLEIKGLTADQIIEKVKPLDIITWAGHVMIILDKNRIIESRRGANDTGGTKIRPLKEVLEETMQGKTAANDYYKDPRVDGKKNFVIRRWFEGK